MEKSQVELEKPTYLTVDEVRAILKCSRSGADAAVNKLAARGAQVIMLQRKLINEQDFYKYLEDFKI